MGGAGWFIGSREQEMTGDVSGWTLQRMKKDAEGALNW